MARVRTNIEIDDDDVRVIMDRFGVHTKTEAVALATNTINPAKIKADKKAA